MSDELRDPSLGPEWFEPGQPRSRRRAHREADLAFYEAASEDAGRRLSRLNPQVLKQHQAAAVRCPANGCLLVMVYGLPVRGGGERFLGAFRTSRRDVTYRFLNWAFRHDGWAPPWFPASCRHGSVRVEVPWLLDGCIALIRGWWGPDFRDQASPEMLRGLASRNFHPDPRHWKGKASDAGSVENATSD